MRTEQEIRQAIDKYERAKRRATNSEVRDIQQAVINAFKWTLGSKYMHPAPRDEDYVMKTNKPHPREIEWWDSLSRRIGREII